MRVTLKLHDGTTVVLQPGPTRAEAPCDCPECGEKLAVQGDGVERSECDRYYRAQGHCAACRAHVGEIRAHPATIFGIEEDEAMLVHGRARVY